MLWVNWPVLDTIHSSSNKFAMGVNIKATGELEPHGRDPFHQNFRKFRSKGERIG